MAKLPRYPDRQDCLNIERINHLYGNGEWQQIPTDLELTREEREIAYGTLYRNRVKAIDEGLWVKNIALRFTGMNREAYSLLLTTRDADGGMRMNEVLRKAESGERPVLRRSASGDANHTGQVGFAPANMFMGSIAPDSAQS